MAAVVSGLDQGDAVHGCPSAGGLNRDRFGASAAGGGAGPLVGHVRRVNTDRPVDARPLLGWVRLGRNAPREEEVAEDQTGDEHAG